MRLLPGADMSADYPCISFRFRSPSRSPERASWLCDWVCGHSGTVSKTVVRLTAYRGFESHPLRLNKPFAVPLLLAIAAAGLVGAGPFASG